MRLPIHKPMELTEADLERTEKSVQAAAEVVNRQRLTTKEVAEELGVAVRDVRKLIRTRVLPAQKLGGRWIIERDNLNFRA